MVTPMKLREALLLQSPSLALQRAAADEIASLDAAIEALEEQYAMCEAHYSLMVNYLVGSGQESDYNEWFESQMENVEVH